MNKHDLVDWNDFEKKLFKQSGFKEAVKKLS